MSRRNLIRLCQRLHTFRRIVYYYGILLFLFGEALIARAQLDSLELVGCTLDPGGNMMLNENRAPIKTSIDLKIPFGFC